MSIKDGASLISIATAFAFVLSGTYSIGFFFRIDIDLITTLQATDYLALGIRGLPAAVASLMIGALIGFYRVEKRARLKVLFPPKETNEVQIGSVPISQFDAWLKDKRKLRRQLYFILSATILIYLIVPDSLRIVLVPGAFSVLFLIYLNFDHENDFYLFSGKLYAAVGALIFLGSTFLFGYSEANRKMTASNTEYQIVLKSDAVVMANIIASTGKYLLVQTREPSRLVMILWDEIRETSKATPSNEDFIIELNNYRKRFQSFFE